MELLVIGKKRSRHSRGPILVRVWDPNNRAALQHRYRERVLLGTKRLAGVAISVFQHDNVVGTFMMRINWGKISRRKPAYATSTGRGGETTFLSVRLISWAAHLVNFLKCGIRLMGASGYPNWVAQCDDRMHAISS